MIWSQALFSLFICQLDTVTALHYEVFLQENMMIYNELCGVTLLTCTCTCASVTGGQSCTFNCL